MCVLIFGGKPYRTGISEYSYGYLSYLYVDVGQNFEGSSIFCWRPQRQRTYNINRYSCNPHLLLPAMSNVTTPVFGCSKGGPSANDGCQSTSHDWSIDQSADSMDFDFLTEYLLEDSSSGAPAPFDINSSPEQIIENDASASHTKKMQPSSAQSDLGSRNIQAKQQGVPPAGSIAVDAKTDLQKPTERFGPNPDYIAHEPAKRQRIENSTASTNNVKKLNVASQVPADALAGRGRKKTQAQIDRRRERNRILARRTRLRKKFFFESLQKEVVDLQRENAALKDIVRSKLSEDGTKILEECSAAERLPDAVLEACGEHTSDVGPQDFNLVRSIQQSQHSFVITDPSLQDNPIVFASDDFLNLTGYSREEVLGRNCRFLQGVDTCPTKVQAIRRGIASGSDVSLTLLNYTSNGTPFWNKLFIAALRDAQDNIVNFIGVLVKVASPEPDDEEHVKSLPDGGLAM